MLLPGCFSVCCVPPPPPQISIMSVGYSSKEFSLVTGCNQKHRSCQSLKVYLFEVGWSSLMVVEVSKWRNSTVGCWKVHEKKVSEKVVMNTSKLDVHLLGPMLQQMIQHYLQIFVDLDAQHGTWMQITAFFTAKYSNNMSIQGFFSTIRQSFCVTKRHWLWVSGICIHVLWPFWATLADLGRQCRDAWCSNNSHGSGIEGNAPWEAPEKWGSNWAQNPESRVAAWWLIHR